MKKRILFTHVILIILVLISNLSFSHSGRTDSNGGHNDNNNKSGLGSYHYHHGYGPHLHTNGCPYSITTTPSNSQSNSTTVKEAAPSIKFDQVVEEYQGKLNEINYNCGVADGYLGSQTKKTILKFQEDENLSVDGSLNSETKKRIESLYSIHIKNLKATEITSSIPNLVELVQDKLIKLDFYKGEIDGVIGPITLDAIKLFQLSKGICVNGNISPMTIYYLELDY